MVRVTLKYDPGIMFPWRVVYKGTNECVQTCGEPMAYKFRRDALNAIRKEGHELMEK